ncbi:MAG: alpha/beta hydrolase [Propionicimonas sp.]
MSRALGVAVRVLAGLGVGVGVVAGATVFKLNGRFRPALQYGFSPFEVGAPSADVAFAADDGVRLAGWWLEAPEAETVVICCHGHRGTKADLLGIGSGLWRAGHSVLLFDFRGNGDSGDGRQSLSHFEQRDVRAAVDFVRHRQPGSRIAVVGFSMGAAATILAAAEDQRIEAVVADSAFAVMTDVVAAAYARYRLPDAMVPVANLLNRAVHGYSFDEVRPVDRIAAIAPRPMLLLHGTADQVIPYHQLARLVEAAGSGAVETVSFEGAEHCGGYFADRPGYIALVSDFLDRAFA